MFVHGRLVTSLFGSIQSSSQWNTRGIGPATDGKWSHDPITRTFTPFNTFRVKPRSCPMPIVHPISTFSVTYPLRQIQSLLQSDRAFSDGICILKYQRLYRCRTRNRSLFSFSTFSAPLPSSPQSHGFCLRSKPE